ncbi:MAG: energy-coupling factor transporter ATPase [Clostridia bacterium]|nr:energy-coupling factor transporter ATPase [Clostridia bacterium]
MTDTGKTGYIQCRNLSFSYEPKPESGPVKYALKDVGLTFEKGEFVAVIGRNSSGKSTLAKLFSLIIEPTSGELVIDGKTVSSELTDAEILDIHRKVGMVFQNPDNQLIATVVEEDIAFGPENLGCPPDEIRRRVDSALAAVSLTDYAGAEPARLSGGQKQRVAIAGVLAMQPECIIFDESTAMLDPIGRRDVMNIMRSLKDKGITVINITHLMDEAARADRIVILDGGSVIAEGTPKDILSDTALLEQYGIIPPQCTALLNELRKKGFDLPSGVTPDEVADIIAAAAGL